VVISKFLKYVESTSEAIEHIVMRRITLGRNVQLQRGDLFGAHFLFNTV